MLPQFMNPWVILLCLLCFSRAIYMHDQVIFSPSHGGTMTMTLEASVSWLLRGRVISRGVPFQLLLSYWPLSGGAYGCILGFTCYLQGDCGVCSTPLHMELIPPPSYILEVTPLVHVEAAPQLIVHTTRLPCYDLDELVAFYHVIMFSIMLFFHVMLFQVPSVHDSLPL